MSKLIGKLFAALALAFDWVRNPFKNKVIKEHESPDLHFKPLLEEWGKQLQREEITDALSRFPPSKEPWLQSYQKSRILKIGS